MGFVENGYPCLIPMSERFDHIDIRSGFFAVVLSAFYMAGYMIWYGNTPLGLYPALDGAQNLETGRLLWSGMYQGGIFQRSPFYSLLLAWMYGLEGFTGIDAAFWARVLNGFAVIVSAWMVGSASFLLWRSRRSVVFGVILVGMNPVVLFFAGDPLDISLASCCMAVFMWMNVRAIRARRFDGVGWLLGGLVLGLGIALRPMFLFMGWMWPIYAMLRYGMTRRKDLSWKSMILHGFLASVGLLGSYAFNGWANWRWGDQLYFQQRGSAYSVWWGNSPLSNGRYYTQSAELLDLQAWENPMVVESELIFAELSGRKGPFEEREINSYFLREAIQMVLDDPVSWMLLMTKKIQSLIHDHEQFDNKTYAFHKERSPWLKWNPIGWGMLMVTGVGGLWILMRRKDESGLFLIVVLVLYSGVILATFTANRYRVPLVPVLALLSSWLAHPLAGIRAGKRLDWTFPVLLSFVAIIVFGPFWGIKGKDSRDADYCLLARACHLSGDDVSAVHWADMALETVPWRNDIQGLRIVSRFNLWFFSQEQEISCEELRNELNRMNQLERRSPAVEFARGIYCYKLGETSTATNVLASIAEHHALAREALGVILQEPFYDAEPAVRWDRALSRCADAPVDL